MILFLVLILSFTSIVKCEIYSSVASLNEVLLVEKKYISVLQEYIEHLSSKLELVNDILEYYQTENESLEENLLEVGLNPLKIYKTIKRVIIDWHHVETLLRSNMWEDFQETIDSYRTDRNLSVKTEAYGIIEGVIRLQEAYRLNVQDMVNGVLNSVKYDVNFTKSDCVEVANFLFSMAEYKMAKEWYMAAKNISTEISVLDELNNEQVDFQINDNLARIKGIEDEYIWKNKVSWFANTDQELCKRGKQLNETDVDRLKCYMEHSVSHFLRIAPLKVEEVKLIPRILVYHEVISDDEISILIDLAKDRFIRVNMKEGGSKDYRVAQVGWLGDEEHPIIQRMSQRVEDMTGLTMSTAEKFQIGNYGIGGHYARHYDSGIQYISLNRSRTKISVQEQINGPRISTVLFYISDVEQGGATVFPELGIAVKPEKGSAVFWYNFDEYGDPDMSTLHASCPVLVGSKWIANKWIHAKEQEFRRLCPMKPKIHSTTT